MVVSLCTMPLPSPPLTACGLFHELVCYEEVQHPVMTGLVNLLQPLRDVEGASTRETAHSTGKGDKEGRKGEVDE